MAQIFFSGPVIDETVEPWNTAKFQNGENRIQIFTYPNYKFEYFEDKENVLEQGICEKFICLRFMLTNLTAVEKNGTATDCKVIYGPIWKDYNGTSGDTNAPFTIANDYFDKFNPSDEIYIYCIGKEHLSQLRSILNIPKNALVISEYLKAILFRNDNVCGGYELYYFIEVFYFEFPDFQINGKKATPNEIRSIISNLAPPPGGTPPPFPIPPIPSQTAACGTRIPNE